jgi:competence protein ComEA
MPLRRAPLLPDPARVVAVLGGPPPGRVREGWVPDAPGGASQVELLEKALRAGQESPEGKVLRAVEDPGATHGADAELARLDEDLRHARRPAVFTVPEQLRSGRLTVSSSAVLSVLALVVALACVFALRVLWAERSAGALAPSAPRGGAAVSVTPRPGAGSVRPTTAGGVTPSGVPGQVVVHVVGQVRRPGLVKLAAGARVADAIERAGGAGTGADLSTLNLARVLVDGEQVRVPRPGEVLPGSAAGGASPGGAAAPGGAGALVDLNTADLAALDTLPGVGPVLAQRIIDWRSEHGRFTSVEELGEVSGIGDKLYAQIRPRVTV